MSSRATTLHDARLVVSGATGFLGSAFVRHALRAGAKVSAIVRPETDRWRLADVRDGLELMEGSVTDLRALRAPGDAAGTIMVHFAAAGVNQTFDDVDALVGVNVAGTAQALAWAQRNNFARFVLVGTSGEYGPGVALTEDAPLAPTSEYGATRAAASMLARAFAQRRGLDVVIVRPFAVYGPYEPAYRLIPYCILRALRGAPIQISSGVQTRDYVHVDDVAHGIALACESPSAGRGVFNLSTGVETPVRSVADAIVRLVGSRSVIDNGRPAIPGEMWRTSGSPARAAKSLGWTPAHTLESGITATIEWFRSQGRHLPAYAESAT
jgi:dTDP-glucose 4,6-dehydratase